MNVLLVTRDFRSFGIATRLAKENHEVTVYTGRTKGMSFGEGLVKFVAHPLEAIKECQFIIVDGPIEKSIYDWSKTYNKPVVGSSPMTDLMNADVYKEVQIAQRFNIPLPTTEVIGDVSDMYSKILDWNPIRTTIRYDRNSITIDQREWMAWAMHKLPVGKKLVLQTPEFGEAVDVIGWFDGLHWAEPFLLKSTNDANLRASTLLALYDRAWVDRAVRPWEQLLRSINYKGPFRVRLCLSKDECTVLSTYAGIEFPSVYAFLEGIKEPIADFFNRIAFGNCPEYDITKDHMSAFSVGTTIADPEGIPILGLDEGNTKHIFFGAVAQRPDGPIISKGLPWVYVVAARGRDIDESFGRAYFTASVVKVPEPKLTNGLPGVYKPWMNRVRSLGYL